jgi:hypothetical protein
MRLPLESVQVLVDVMKELEKKFKFMNFNFKEDYILENDVVRLQPLQASDYEKLVEFSINEPELWSFNANGPDNPRKFKEIHR